MARYVMLEFDDDKMAEDFIKAVRDQAGVIYPVPVVLEEGKRETKFEPLVARVRGLWFKPTKFCDCDLSKTGERFVKGSKYGMFVHAHCKKPRPGQYQHPKNLIDPLAQPPHVPKLFMGSQEPPTSDPAKYPNGRELPMMQIQLREPTPKAETDRVQENLNSL